MSKKTDGVRVFLRGSFEKCRDAAMHGNIVLLRRLHMFDAKEIGFGEAEVESSFLFAVPMSLPAYRVSEYLNSLTRAAAGGCLPRSDHGHLELFIHFFLRRRLR